MPVIGISVARLHQLLKAEVSAKEVEGLLGEIGCDVDGVVDVRRFRSKHSDYEIELTPQESLPLSDPTSGVSVERGEELWEQVGEETVVRLDLLPVRPDLFDAGGLARALRGYLGVETGLKDYAAADSTWRVEVDPRITDPSFRRPLIQCAIIRNLEIDDDLLRAIMRLQENLHWALCRDRKFASIGAYDLDTLENPIRYTLVDRQDFRFTPLFWGHRGAVSPQLMLEEHPKGVGYAHLVEGLTELPALLSANDNVLSLPPIINAEETKLTTDTRNVLLDVTGHNLPVVTKALAILATSLVELDPTGQATLERVQMVYPDHTEETPELANESYTVDPARAAKLIGVMFDRAGCGELLRKMRHGVDDPGEGQPLDVTVAAYRKDIMHEVDLIEDAAIAYGYHRIKPQLVPTFTVGRSLKANDLARRAASALLGLKFMETVSLVLTCERNHYEKLNQPITERRVTLANPAASEQTMLREHLYSSLLEQLATNTDHPLPQRIFEVGDVTTFRGVPAESERPRELKLIAGAVCASRVGYADGRSVLDALLHELQLGGAEGAAALIYTAAENPTAIPGRAARVSIGTRQVADVFEVHPTVLENWGINAPVVLFSVELGAVQYHL